MAEIWTNQTEQMIKNVGDLCGSYHWMNNRISEKLMTIYNIIMGVTIILPIFMGVLISSDLTVYIAIRILVTIFSITITCSGVVVKNFKFEEKASQHKSFSSDFFSLGLNIMRQLSVSRNSRRPANVYIDWCTSNYDELYKKMPLIPESIRLEWEVYAKKNGMSVPKELDYVIVSTEESKEKSEKEEHHDTYRYTDKAMEYELRRMQS